VIKRQRSYTLNNKIVVNFINTKSLPGDKKDAKILDVVYLFLSLSVRVHRSRMVHRQNLLGHYWSNRLGQNISEKNVLGQNVSGHNVSGENVPGQNVLGQSVSGQNISGQNLIDAD